MKRVAVLLLAFILLFSVTAISESSKYASLSLEELVKERNEIEAEIVKRIGTAISQIHSGEYIVGKHIKAATYTLTCLSTIGGAQSTVKTYESSGYLTSAYLKAGESTTVLLEESSDMSNGLLLIGGTFSIVPVEKPSWAP